MYIYRVIKERQRDEITTEEILFETKKQKELLEKYEKITEEDIKQLKEELRNLIEERKEIVKDMQDMSYEDKISFIYSDSIARKVIDTSKAPDEYILLEVEYKPLDLLKKEIENILEKEVNIDFENKIYIKHQKQNNHDRILLTQYSPERKKSMNKASIKFNETKYKKLKSIEKIFNELLEK